MPFCDNGELRFLPLCLCLLQRLHTLGAGLWAALSREGITSGVVQVSPLTPLVPGTGVVLLRKCLRSHATTAPHFLFAPGSERNVEGR